MNNPETVVIAMSGGVDSSVSAALLKQQGYNVIGLMLRLWSEDCKDSNRCCTPESVDDARAVADSLGIPFYVLDYKDQFKEVVVKYFTETYQNAMTPNPCLVCNKNVRFGMLLEEAKKLGATKMATGHYIQLLEEDGALHIHKGVDVTKDQSYVLYQLDQEQLQCLLFPLGGMNKTRVRELAAEFNLSVASRPDSQDLCFVGDDGYRGFLERHGTKVFEPGDFVDTDGNILGQHMGLTSYTVGQRRGLGVSSHEPLYVIRLDEKTNQVVLGRGDERAKQELWLTEMTYPSGVTPKIKKLTVKIRYTAKPAECLLTPIPGGRAHLQLNEPIKDATPGQAAVLYDGEKLIGGGIIQKESLG